MPKIKCGANAENKNQGQSQKKSSREGGAAFGRPTFSSIVLLALALVFIFCIGPTFYFWHWPHILFPAVSFFFCPVAGALP